jgi:hypothetical protein
LRLLQRGGVGDALAALRRGEGGDAQMGRTDAAFFPGGSRWDGHQLLQPRGLDAVAALGSGLGQDTVRV